MCTLYREPLVIDVHGGGAGLGVSDAYNMAPDVRRSLADSSRQEIRLSVQGIKGLGSKG